MYFFSLGGWLFNVSMQAMTESMQAMTDLISYVTSIFNFGNSLNKESQKMLLS